MISREKLKDFLFSFYDILRGSFFLFFSFSFFFSLNYFFFIRCEIVNSVNSVECSVQVETTEV